MPSGHRGGLRVLDDFERKLGHSSRRYAVHHAQHRNDADRKDDGRAMTISVPVLAIAAVALPVLGFVVGMLIFHYFDLE